MKTRIKVITFLLLLLGMESYAQNKTPDKKFKAYMVADAHLDTQWNWDVQTTINKHVRKTLTQNLFLLKHYPDYIFNFEGGVKYAWMKEYYPEQYEEVKQYVKAGRWHLAGSSWEASDVIIPSVESSIRNILLGQNFYRREFGVEGKDIFLPDCFGFGWTLPSIASHCGLIGFSSQKLGWRYHPFYGDQKYPFTIGLWKGIDGNEVMFAHGYDYGHRWNDEDLSESSDLEGLAKSSSLNTVYRYYGTGDTGGSPTLGSVRSVEKGIKGKGPVEIISAASDQLFKDYQPFSSHPELPVFNGELLMDVHGTGCYTSEAAMKLYNRQNEQLGDAAERAAVTADWLGGNYPGKTLTDSWKRFIFHQFHDDLTGTSIPKAYEFSWNDELISLKQFSSVLSSSVTAIAGQMDTRVKGIPVILYNANDFPVSDIADISINMSEKPNDVRVYDAQGKRVASQLIGYEKGKARILLAAHIPENGYGVYGISAGKGQKNSLPDSHSMIENSVYKITLDKNGDVSSLIDKRNGKELVKEGEVIRLALFTRNESYQWPAWEILKETIDRNPISITDHVQITPVENGVLRKTICIEKQYGQSLFKQYIRLYEGSRADRIDFYNEIDWQSGNALLKAEFPLTVNHDKATYDLGLGCVERGNNTPTAYEVYAQQWADLTDKQNSYGVSILNNCKYGWDKPNDHTLRLTLLHTPSTQNNYSYQDHQDFGHHVFTYSLVGHVGALDKSSTARKAELLNQPLKAFVTVKHNGPLGKEFSFIRSNNKDVMIKALKKAENTDEYVVRVYETGGVDVQQAKITFAGEIEKAYEADGTEKTIREVPFKENQLSFSIPSYGIKTFKVTLKKKHLIEPLQIKYVPLNYDRKCFSWNAFRTAADFESGNSYAAELLPDSVLKADGLPFRLGEKEVANGMTCKGNIIELPAGHQFNRLYLLAASTNEDHAAIFHVGNKKEEFTIPYYSGFIGQWGHLNHTEGFLKQAEIAYVGTHRHCSEGDEAYVFTYMFKISLDIPVGATTVTLPDNPNIVLFAATLVHEDYPQVVQASTLFQTALKQEKQLHQNKEVNLLKQARILDDSGEINEEEKAEFAIDGDLQTKWYDVGSTPHFIDFDLGQAKVIQGWKLVNAGKEDYSYITRNCFLQGKNSLDGKWETIDALIGNHKNEVSRMVNPLSFRYIRFLVTQPTQENEVGASRIYELEVF